MVDRIPEKKNGLDLMTVLAYLIVARLSCVALSNIPVFTMTFTFMYGTAFVGLFLLTTRHVSVREILLLVISLLYALYVVCQGFVASKGLFFTDAFNAYVIVFLVAIYLWVKRQPLSTQRGLFWVICFGLLFSYVYSIYILTKDPDASRVVASAQRSPYDVIHAVGGFEEVYGGVYFVCILLFMGKAAKGEKIKGKFIGTVLLLLAVAFIVMASYATAILLLILGISLFFSSRNKTVFFSLIAAAVLLLIFHEKVGQWIMDVSARMEASNMLRERMYNIGEMFKTFEATGTYAGDDGRLVRMDRSWQTFLHYPIFGGFTRPDGRYGGHSEFFDVLAKYGSVGMLMLVVLFINLYRDVHAGLKVAGMKRCCKIIFLIYVITAVVNPALYAGQILPLILILPLASELVADAKKNNSNAPERG